MTTAVVTETVPIHIADGDGTVLGISVMPITAPTSSDTVTIDLKKGNASTSYATMLSAVVTLNSSSVTRTIYNGSLASSTYSDGDSFELVVTATGSSCQGLAVSVNFAENPV